MLHHMHVRNFKSWEELVTPLAPLTGLFGTNSSGKTSILQFLLMLKQTKDTRDRAISIDFGGTNSLVNLGSFKDVVYCHDDTQVLEWNLNWSLRENLDITDPSGKRTLSLFSGDRLGIEARTSLRRGAPECSYLGYEFDNTVFSISPKKMGGTEFELRAEAGEGASKEQNGFSFTRNPGRVWQLPGPVKSYAFPDQAKTYFQNANFLGDFELEFEKLMDSIHYLGPLREFPKREYKWGGTSPTDVGQKGEMVVDAILAARSRKEERNLGPKQRYKPFEAILGHWLKKLGLIYDFRVEEIGSGANLYRIIVQRSPQSSEVLITDVGFGVSQILPVLVLLYYVPEGSIVLLEQPEIHLHPSVQSGLADVIINVAIHRNVQVIVESHSEHLLRRLQRRVAEGILPNEKAGLFFCEGKGEKSTLTYLELNLYGEITNWPDNFFGDDFGEIAAAQEAALKRKIEDEQ